MSLTSSLLMDALFKRSELHQQHIEQQNVPLHSPIHADFMYTLLYSPKTTFFQIHLIDSQMKNANGQTTSIYALNPNNTLRYKYFIFTW
jgi:hypothetical protein